MKTYTVRTGREDAWWWIEIPDVEMGYSQARKFRDIVPMATEAISLLLDIPPDSFAVEIQIA